MYGNNSRYYGLPLLRTKAKYQAETTKECIETTVAITDTPPLKTKAKSPAETTKKCIETTLAITDTRY